MRHILRVLLVILLAFLIALPAVASFSDLLKEGAGLWLIEEEVDPLTDEVNVILALMCNETVEKHKEGAHVEKQRIIILRFMDGEKDLLVFWDDYLGENNLIVYRFDDRDAQESQWDIRQSSDTLFFPKAREDLDLFIEELLLTETFIVGITPHERRRESVIFDVRGLGQALLPYLGVFGWERLEETIAQTKSPFVFSSYIEELNSPYLLLEDPFIKASLEELLKEEYERFIESMQLIDLPMDYNQHDGTITMHGGVPGLFTIMEGKMQVNEEGDLHVAYLDDFRIMYFTNRMEDLVGYQKPNLLGWGHSFPEYPFVFGNVKPPDSLEGLIGRYEHIDQGASFDITIRGEEIEYEGQAFFGANVGYVEGVSKLIKGNAPYAVYNDMDYTGAIMQLMFIEGKLFVLEREGSFGGLNVSFNGWYRRVGQ